MEIVQKLKVFKEHPDAKLPVRAKEGDAGLDLTSVEDVVLQPNERKFVDIGLRIVCPKGYYYFYAPRSSMAIKKGVVPNHHNVMDSGYLGPTGPYMYNYTHEPYEIKKGDKICQLMLRKVVPTEVVEISSEEFEKAKLESERGESGFGSTGR